MIKEIISESDYRIFSQIGVDFSKKYPNGITRFLSSQLELFNPQKNFILKNGFKFKCFIYTDGNINQGRIAAFIDPELQKKYPGLGFVGMYDSVDNETVSFSLLNTAIEWLKRSDCKTIVGPVDFSIWHNYRFLTNGFDQEAFLGEPRNPTYYPQLYEKFGFKKKYTWKSQLMDRKASLLFISENKTQADLWNKLGYSYVKLTNKNKSELMKKTYQILIKAYEVFPLFRVISEYDFLNHYAMMPNFIDRDCSLFLYNPDRKFLGFVLLMKDLTEAVRSMNGKTNLISKISFLLNKNKSNIANIAQGATLPFFIREAAVLGKTKFNTPLSIGGAAMCLSLQQAFSGKKYGSAIVSLMRDGAAIINHAQSLATFQREYCLFEYLVS